MPTSRRLSPQHLQLTDAQQNVPHPALHPPPVSVLLITGVSYRLLFKTWQLLPHRRSTPMYLPHTENIMEYLLCARPSGHHSHPSPLFISPGGGGGGGGRCLPASSPLPGICLNPIPSHPASGSPNAVALVQHFDYVPTLPLNLAFDYQRQRNVCVLSFCT